MKRKLISLLVISLFVINGIQAQEKKQGKKTTLKGLVLDAENKAVESAFIFIDDDLDKKLSNKNGLFKIKLYPDTKWITIISPSNGVAEMEYLGEEEMTFVLSKADTQHPLNKAEAPEDDAVSDGFSYKHRRSLVSKVEEVNQKQLEQTRQYLDIYDMIRGKIPGVQVNGNNIVIRGSTSMGSTNKALFVVDGRETNNIDYISPSEVESISVLKSTNLYGSAGAGGVIIIKLKKN